MKRTAVVCLGIILWADSSYGAWLLWKHSLVTRRVAGSPRGLSPEGDVDRWDLLNAVDMRKECLAGLKTEHKKTVDNLAANYPGEPVSQSILADGVSAMVSAGADTIGGAAGKSTQLYYEYTFWCLPAGVDPKSTRVEPERSVGGEKK